MKIKRVFLEDDEDAGWGWEINGKYNCESGYKLIPTFIQYLKRRSFWISMHKRHN